MSYGRPKVFKFDCLSGQIFANGPEYAVLFSGVELELDNVML